MPYNQTSIIHGQVLAELQKKKEQDLAELAIAEEDNEEDDLR